MKSLYRTVTSCMVAILGGTLFMSLSTAVPVVS
jgi:hypothetical protein